MLRKNIGKVHKYIPSRSVRLHNNLIYSSYIVLITFTIGLFGYIHHSNIQIAKMDAEIEELNNQYLAEQLASELKVREAEERIDAQAKIIREQIEREYYKELEIEAQREQQILEQKNLEEKIKEQSTYIRCTGYCDEGITASGEYTRDGIVAGKREWLGKKVALFSVKEDGSIGNLIGNYEFKDTGNGIDTDGDGVGDTIKNGKSIDVWHSTEEACYAWARQYGDYVYMSFLN